VLDPPRKVHCETHPILARQQQYYYLSTDGPAGLPHSLPINVLQPPQLTLSRENIILFHRPSVFLFQSLFNVPMSRASNDIHILDSSSDPGSHDHREEDQLISMDLENYGKEGRARQSGSVIRLCKIPLPLRKGNLGSDLVKNVACFLTLL
jgi:hypothetical protein